MVRGVFQALTVAYNVLENNFRELLVDFGDIVFRLGNLHGRVNNGAKELRIILMFFRNLFNNESRHVGKIPHIGDTFDAETAETNRRNHVVSHEESCHDKVAGSRRAIHHNHIVTLKDFADAGLGVINVIEAHLGDFCQTKIASRRADEVDSLRGLHRLHLLAVGIEELERHGLTKNGSAVFVAVGKSLRKVTLLVEVHAQNFLPKNGRAVQGELNGQSGFSDAALLIRKGEDERPVTVCKKLSSGHIHILKRVNDKAILGRGSRSRDERTSVLWKNGVGLVR